MEVEPAPTDLHQLTVDLTHVIAEPARRKGLRFEVEIASDLPRRVVVDGRHVRQVLLNLLGNAIKFTAAGEVRLTASRNGAALLHFEVRDTGVGIEEKNLSCIFDEFRQTRAGSAAGGTGLGLAISQRLVRAMGGEIGVRSVFGSGSTFFFDIPLVQAAEPAAQTPPAADEPAPDSRLAPECHLTALVADDSSVNRRILASLLESAGAQVITASGGVEAVELTAQYKPHVVLMDLRMDDLDGIAATRRIKADPATASIPVIMVTASAFGDSREAAMEAGCVDFIVKPIRAEHLFQKLQNHLNVRFVTPSAVPTTTGESFNIPTDPDLHPIATRIREAASIGSVAELEAVALQLASATPHLALSRHISRLVSAFDFPALVELAGRMTAETQGRTASSDPS
jgi:CheY-like chemotaxis protein